MLLYRLAQGYAALGAIVAVTFLAIGLGRVDPAARGAYAFRPLLLPGLLLLWPLVLWRWWRLARPATGPVPLGRRYRASHRAVWIGLAVLLPVALLAALSLRQNGPVEAASVQLNPAGAAP
jgi:hypothetical protein